jgi:hypothetical protein
MSRPAIPLFSIQHSPTGAVPKCVPDRYLGVWTRTLLETPEGHDTTTWVRWLQTSSWHADLRVPAGSSRSEPAGLAQQQGFCGNTEITPAHDDQLEICTWHRHEDFQPPRVTPDAGTMVFETADRVIERGVHGTYLEVWERLPESLGRRIVLAALDCTGQPTPERVLVSGAYLMHLRPRAALWPSDTGAGETLADLIQRAPQSAAGLLDFNISFGRWNEPAWTIERSTFPELELQSVEFTLHRTSTTQASLRCARLPEDWQVVEWHTV